MILRNALVLLMLISSLSFGGNRPLPYASTLGHTGADRNGIQFECKAVPNDLNSIVCDFLQIMVYAKLDKKDLDEENLKGVKSVLEELEKSGYEKLINDGLCKTLDSINSKNLSNQSYKFEFISLLKDKCPVNNKKSSQDLLVQIVLMNNRFKSVTCETFINKWTHKFEYQPAGDYWASSDGPNGSCGVINISSLKAPKYASLWDYTTKKVVTNKDGTGGLVSCNQLDESEQTYSWQSEPKPLVCEYIDF